MNLINKKERLIYIGITLVLLVTALSCSKEYGHISVNSPNGRIKTIFQLIDGKPSMSLIKNDKEIIKSSTLGIKLKGFSNAKFEIRDVITKTVKTQWKPVWDKNSTIEDNHNETTFWLETKELLKMGISIRVFNDGIAIRYEIPEQEGFHKFTIMEDLTSFTFPKDYTFWSANGERHNLGPAPLSKYPEFTDYTPTVVDMGKDGYAAILEAAIYDFAHFNLGKVNGELTLKCKMDSSKGVTPTQTSWRVLLLGDRAGDLVESNTLVNLNPPCAIKNPSWIKPGKAVWDWRVWGYKTGDGYTYGLNTQSHKRLIAFASENNIKYLLMDADWYGPEFSTKANPTSANDQINIKENMAYAKSKEVGVILYLNDVGAKKFGLKKILKQFSDWGAAGVKYGFMTTKGQEKVLYTRKVVELCAKYNLTVNFHDSPLPPSGDRRTWPNLIAREYGHSQADAKRSYYPETVVNQVFINMITGPLDMCNLWFGFEGAESRDRVFEKIPGTVAAEVAKLAALFSGIHIIPDAPEEYNKKADIFDFIKTLPDSFDELRILDGHIDEFVTVGRRKGDNWYLGTLNNRDARKINIDFSFLEEGAAYKATIYADSKDTHYENNRESYTVSEININKNDKIDVEMAPGGGHAIRILKQ